MDRPTSAGRAEQPHFADEPGRSPGDVVVIAIFSLLLLAPALLALTGHAGFETLFIESREQRHPFVAPPPSTGALATGGWQRDAERELADAFPLRTSLIAAYERAKFVWLHDVASAQVIGGRHGWFFLGNEERRYITGAAGITDAVLTRAAGVYQQRADWCARRGITYVFVLAPNKSTVYANELPPQVQLVTPTLADRLFPMLRARGVRVVDLRARLTAAAASGEVYSKGDTHWNDAGAYIAYRATVAALAGAGVRDTVTPSAFRRWVASSDGDLLKLAGVSDLVENHVVRYDFPQHARSAVAPVYPDDPRKNDFAATATAVSSPASPKAVVFGDSFSDVLVRFLAEDFRRTVLLRYVSVTGPQFDERIVETEKPAVVIQELAERNLMYARDVRP